MVSRQLAARCSGSPKGRGWPKVTGAQSLNYIIRVCFRLYQAGCPKSAAHFKSQKKKKCGDILCDCSICWINPMAQVGVCTRVRQNQREPVQSCRFQSSSPHCPGVRFMPATERQSANIDIRHSVLFSAVLEVAQTWNVFFIYEFPGRLPGKC